MKNLPTSVSSLLLFSSLQNYYLKFSTQDLNKNYLKSDVSLMSRYFKEKVEKSCLKVEYFFVASIDDLIPTSKLELNKKYRFFVAVYAGKTRLVDTVELDRI